MSGGAGPRLALADMLVILAIVTALFLFAHGPAWQHAWDYALLWKSIFWSYLPIPLLVAVALLLRKRWSLRGFLLDTMIVTMLKFSITATFMIAAWSFGDRPPSTPAPSAVIAPAKSPERAAWTPPEPSVIDAGSTVTIAGVVSGRPSSKRLVFVSSGLEQLHFAVPTEPVVLDNDGYGPQPREAVVRVGQRIVLRSLDGRLHTWRGILADGSVAFNHPMLAPADETEVVLEHALGEVVVSCSAHESEASSLVLVLDHPFWTFTEATGGFQFAGVPEGEIHLTVMAIEDGRVLARQSSVDAHRCTGQCRLAIDFGDASGRADQ